MELALDRGQVDAVANAEPIGTILLAHDKVHKVVDQGRGPALLERVLLRYGSQRHVCGQEPQGGGGSNPGFAPGGQMGRCQQDRCRQAGRGEGVSGIDAGAERPGHQGY